MLKLWNSVVTFVVVTATIAALFLAAAFMFNACWALLRWIGRLFV